MRRYGRPVGWRNESYRHYLAAKGITTKRYLKDKVRKSDPTKLSESALSMIKAKTQLASEAPREKELTLDNIQPEDFMVNGEIDWGAFYGAFNKLNDEKAAFKLKKDKEKQEKALDIVAERQLAEQQEARRLTPEQIAAAQMQEDEYQARRENERRDRAQRLSEEVSGLEEQRKEASRELQRKAASEGQKKRREKELAEKVRLNFLKYMIDAKISDAPESWKISYSSEQPKSTKKIKQKRFGVPEEVQDTLVDGTWEDDKYSIVLDFADDYNAGFEFDSDSGHWYHPKTKEWWDPVAGKKYKGGPREQKYKKEEPVQVKKRAEKKVVVQDEAPAYVEPQEDATFKGDWYDSL